MTVDEIEEYVRVLWPIDSTRLAFVTKESESRCRFLLGAAANQGKVAEASITSRRKLYGPLPVKAKLVAIARIMRRA